MCYQVYKSSTSNECCFTARYVCYSFLIISNSPVCLKYMHQPVVINFLPYQATTKKQNSCRTQLLLLVLRFPQTKTVTRWRHTTLTVAMTVTCDTEQHLVMPDAIRNHTFTPGRLSIARRGRRATTGGQEDRWGCSGRWQQWH